MIGCTDQPPEAESKAPESRFIHLELVAGMNRAAVEEQIATLLSTPNSYPLYGNNLEGGTVRYRNDDWVLKVLYGAGTPAPWVKDSKGAMLHRPPIDETVLQFKIERTSPKTH